MQTENKDLKSAYKEKALAEMQEWDAKADLLKAKGSNMAADAKLEFEKQYEAIAEKKAELAAYLDELSDKADDTWDDFKDEAEEKWNKLASSVKNFVSKHT